ncbi:hypothetical protein SPBR_07687 [Sporothrix brasiliensis 5110]|uniref:AB hydrolase-1 domain-containing protein n=1 Tax=Sporothrix brasiliensis 5110 TaxID=1398154 RepID=A0A0C2IU69_9PEZI|nr:uncharacterized protein SPBR_07687 [Sporothrix brasiliensis 5110]KIH88552.1 hypothetical protein SPBR_07687 [Sporothrix brasiliensis 5110]
MASFPPSSTGFAVVSTQPDIRLFYSVTPALPLDASKPVIVLANSLAATTALWDTFTTEFAPTHTIVRYDARFHGHSPLSSTNGFDYEKGHSMDDLADDVIAVLDTIGVASPLTFIGLSIGGGVGVSLAARYPDRFSSFVVVGSRSHAAPGDAARMAERAAYYRSHGARAQAEQSVERWFGNEWPKASPENEKLALQVADIVVQTPVEGFEASAAALNRMDLRGQAATIGSRGDGRRVLFVVGADDGKLVVDESRQLAETTGSRLEVVADCGHIVNVQQPTRFHAIVRAWLADTKA